MAAEAGFDVTLRPTEFAALQKEAQAGNFDVDAIGWSGRVDPDGNIHQFVTCKGGLNDGQYCNPEVDRLLNEARADDDEAKRKELYDDAQAILQDELPIIYLYYQPWPFAVCQEGGGLQGLSRRDDPSQGREVRLLIDARRASRPRTAGRATLASDCQVRRKPHASLHRPPHPDRHPDDSSSCRSWCSRCSNSCPAIPC